MADTLQNLPSGLTYEDFLNLGDEVRDEFYQLGNNGIYELVPAQAGTYKSKVFEGLSLEVATLWQEPLPKLLDVLRTWKVV